jgi:hypothetical protein
LLVYEFLTNKTLDDHLFNRAYPVLPWYIRLEIAMGAAEGLLYLHEGLEVQVSAWKHSTDRKKHLFCEPHPVSCLVAECCTGLNENRL